MLKCSSKAEIDCSFTIICLENIPGQHPVAAGRTSLKTQARVVSTCTEWKRSELLALPGPFEAIGISTKGNGETRRTDSD